MCLCDRHVCPYPDKEGLLPHCGQCRPHKDEQRCAPCPEHAAINCSEEGCDKRFHRSCLQRYGHVELGNNSSEQPAYRCMECDDRAQIGEDTPEGDLTSRDLKTKLRRIGVKLPEDADRTTRQKFKRTYDKQREAMERLMAKKPHRQLEPQPQEDSDSAHSDSEVQHSHNDCQELLDTDPKHHPCPVKMNDCSKDTVLLAGRRFAISMQLFDCDRCSCCGFTKPFHADPTFPPDSDCPFPPKHLAEKYHPAWKCDCEMCKGALYYGAKRNKIMDFYRQQHGGREPWEVMPSEEEGRPNAMLCNSCYHEQSAKDEDSHRQCFGSLFQF